MSQASAALLSQERFGGLDFQVELGESFAPPAAVRPVAIAILWQAERPLAVVAGDVLTLARTACRAVREPLVAAAREARLEVAYARESQLWSLRAPPPARLRALRTGSLPV